MPKTIDRCLAFIVVTPSIHEVHHQTNWKESNSNFGSVFTCWDRLFKTFMNGLVDANNPDFGIKGFQSIEQQKLIDLIRQPFAK